MAFFRNGALIERMNSTVTSGGTLVLNKSSLTYQRFTGTLAHVVTLPDATTLDVSRKFVFENRSTGLITISNFSSGFVCVILPLSERELRLADKSTAAGVWDIATGVQSEAPAQLAAANP